MNRTLCAAACALAYGVLATTLSAQHYAPQYYGPQYYAPQSPTYPSPYAATAPQYGQPYGGATAARPAGYRIPMLTARQQTPQQYCPPGQHPYPQHSPSPSPGQTQQPGTRGDTQQPQNRDTTDPFRSPSDSPSDQQSNQQSNQQQAQQPDQQSQNDFTPTDSGTRANLSPGTNTPQLGRNDQTNRLNLFDNMAAAPQSRVWFGMQYAKDFDTGLQLTPGFRSFLAAYSPVVGAPSGADQILALNQGITTEFFQYNQRLYRVGGEWAPTHYFSVAVQGQYYAANGDFPDSAPDDWTNPQIMTKLVLARDCDSVLSATLGVTPETSSELGQINERVTKLYPGMLFYEGITHDLFTQGGVQTGLPVDGSNEVYTFDWSLALGYWLYRDPCPCGPSCCERPNFLRSLKVTGIIPQVNVLGKHTVGNRQTVGPFGFDPFATEIVVDQTTRLLELCDPVTGLPVGLPLVSVTTPVTIPFVLPEGFVIYREPRDVIDLTVGGQILFGDHIQVGLGYSFPLTDESVRRDEFTSTLTFAF